MMADCEGKLTGKPGICFVTRGPGATNASAGVHIARQDSNPMILFIGQIARGIASARPSRRSTTSASSATSPNGWSRSTTRRAFPNW
jgi:thiamine pyrophosphate-dependent acetolactate synthase large subunit-like protein